jgi:hypothetical protein
MRTAGNSVTKEMAIPNRKKASIGCPLIHSLVFWFTDPPLGACICLEKPGRLQLFTQYSTPGLNWHRPSGRTFVRHVANYLGNWLLGGKTYHSTGQSGAGGPGAHGDPRNAPCVSMLISRVPQAVRKGVWNSKSDSKSSNKLLLFTISISFDLRLRSTCNHRCAPEPLGLYSRCALQCWAPFPGDRAPLGPQSTSQAETATAPPGRFQR